MCDEDEWDFVLRSAVCGSVNTTAVAGRVLGTKKPETSKLVENIDTMLAPSIPSTIAATSASKAKF